MIEKATDPQLEQAFQSHLQETETHVSRLQDIVTQIYGDEKTQKCKVTSALISSAEDMIKDATDPSVRDAALIAAGQQVEHHEMAIYGTLRSWAKILGDHAQAESLAQILEQEKHADAKLTEISGHVNQDAETRAHAA
jgi:ferritin-like metal-binding protein YciE